VTELHYSSNVRFLAGRKKAVKKCVCIYSFFFFLKQTGRSKAIIHELLLLPRTQCQNKQTKHRRRHILRAAIILSPIDRRRSLLNIYNILFYTYIIIIIIIVIAPSSYFAGAGLRSIVIILADRCSIYISARDHRQRSLASLLIW